MPLTHEGKEALARFRYEYGKKKGTSVFYATLNKKPKLKSVFEHLNK
jgi:hypothetical protein